MNKHAQETFDPLRLGIQLGMVGAASGLGWAALHRAVRVHYGSKRPVPVVRPILTGALIGMTLGTTASAAKWKHDMQPTKYAALNRMLRYPGEKRALFDAYSNWSDAHPLASTAGYFTPFLGSAMSAADATHAAGEGRWGAALGNALMVPFGLVGGAGVLKALPKLGLLARVGRTALGEGPNAARAAKAVMNSHQNMGVMKSMWQRPAVAMFGKQLRAADPARLERWAQGGQRLENAMGVNTRIRGSAVPAGWRNPSVFNTMMVGSIPLTMMGGTPNPSGNQMGNQPVPQQPGMFSAQPPPTRYRGLGYISGLQPSKLPFNGYNAESPYAGYEQPA